MYAVGVNVCCYGCDICCYGYLGVIRCYVCCYGYYVRCYGWDICCYCYLGVICCYVCCYGCYVCCYGYCVLLLLPSCILFRVSVPGSVGPWWCRLWRGGRRPPRSSAGDPWRWRTDGCTSGIASGNPPPTSEIIITLKRCIVTLPAEPLTIMQRLFLAHFPRDAITCWKLMANRDQW